MHRFMRCRIPLLSLFACLLMVLWLLSRPGSGYTRLELTNAATGINLASFVLADDEQIVLTWRNSIWGLDVTEAFVAKSGLLIQTEVTFADPDGSQPPHVTPQDVYIACTTQVGRFRRRGLPGRSIRLSIALAKSVNPR